MPAWAVKNPTIQLPSPQTLKIIFKILQFDRQIKVAIAAINQNS
jgi:hypothetical protein